MVTTVDGTVEPYESPDITTVEELVEFWDEDWGALKIDYPEQHVIVDSCGTPQSAIDHVLEYRGSGITVDVVNDRDSEYQWSVDNSGPTLEFDAPLVIGTDKKREISGQLCNEIRQYVKELVKQEYQQHPDSIGTDLSDNNEIVGTITITNEEIDFKFVYEPTYSGDVDLRYNGPTEQPTVVEDSSDTSCTNGGNEQTFAEDMRDLADELDEKEWGQKKQRVDEYLREQRDVFKAEITEVRDTKQSTDEVVFIVDIPTHGSYKYIYCLPDGEGSGERLYEILDYLGATLRDMDIVEGMYLPVTYVDGDWIIQLPSDAPPFTESFWLKPRPLSLPKWMTVKSDIPMKYPRLAFSTFILCTIVFFIGLVVSVQMLGNGDFISGIILLIITLVAGQGTRITFP